MKTQDLFKHYSWLVMTIYEAKDGITLAQINERWIRSSVNDGTEMSRTTFKRHKAAIEELFGIIIECDIKNGYIYTISNREILEKDTVQNWLFSTLSVNNIISRSMSMQNRILLEEVPSGGTYLETIINAMKESRVVEVKYQRFGQAEASQIVIEPYALKLFGQRWYVLGHTKKHDLAVYALDRMKEIAIGDAHYSVSKSFDARRYFDECYGVIAGDGTKAERVKIRVFGKERYYIDSLPLHHTQCKTYEGDEYNEYELHLRPTYDFKQALLANAADIEVIEPQSLREDIKELLTRSLGRY